ncbi:Crp/Fnr family transcriptional regulator [Leptolyngbyaceae cyanobacterium CCMR0082]|uniref:Crp/Fnr family transcriptional regulator n=2 Tax=Adonisia turfae TaxID=2950184 RepID=A0A6M0SIA5_9CYAN|nr:Crp/Fnr family transcriptional regulator [Adonisia turfae]NEZ58390.1 Crp/Fnr family transcriptional regulator [Adonisia turfae CCMR0081]NEZ67691.1 Crp/Fnr family transcriptional regulator [Adonisia turfae CCMR0082]
MRPDLLSELFPLFNAANPETLTGLLSASTELTYPAGRTVLMEDSWGNAIYLIVAGWIKVRHDTGGDYVTLAVLGKGDFFGEMAILDESPRSTDVVALSPVKLLSIPAQHFIDTLFQDHHLHHRMLQMMVQRLRHTNSHFQRRRKPMAVKLAHTLVALAEAYGDKTNAAPEIFNLTIDDLAAIANIPKDDATKIMEKLHEKDWVVISDNGQTLQLKGFNHLTQLAQK